MQFFGGVPLWHCSVALHASRDQPSPLPLARWTGSQRRTAKRIVFAALDGVGIEAAMHWEDGRISISGRRQMTADEVDGLPRDMADPGPSWVPLIEAPAPAPLMDARSLLGVVPGLTGA